MAGVTFCDSQGLGTLVVLSRKAQHARAVLALTNVGDFLMRVLDITGPTLRPDDQQPSLTLGFRDVGACPATSPHGLRKPS